MDESLQGAGVIANLINNYGLPTTLMSLGLIAIIYMVWNMKKNSEQKDKEMKVFFDSYIKEKDASTEEWKTVAEKAISSFEILSTKHIEGQASNIRVQEQVAEKLSRLIDRIEDLPRNTAREIKAVGI